jgi:hypothetical protein
MSRSRLCGWPIGVILGLLSPAFGQQLNTDQIDLVKKTANDICTTIKQIRGQSTETQLEGDVQAKLSGLAGSLFGVGVSGKASRSTEEFEGLSRDATALALQGDRECREKLFEKMFDALMKGASLESPAHFEVFVSSSSVPTLAGKLFDVKPHRIIITNLSHYTVGTMDVDVRLAVTRTTPKWHIDPSCELKKTDVEETSSEGDQVFTILASCNEVQQGEKREFSIGLDPNYELNHLGSLSVYLRSKNSHLEMTFFATKFCGSFGHGLDQCEVDYIDCDWKDLAVGHSIACEPIH